MNIMGLDPILIFYYIQGLINLYLIKNIKIIVLNYFFIIFLLLFNKNYILK